MTDKPRPFKPINVTVPHWNEYNAMAIKLSAKRGKRLSIPALLDEAYREYISNNK